jgi:hypothetical protein
VTDSKNNYQSTDEIEAIVRDFESCTTPPAEFSHRSHLTVALSYLHLSGLSIAEAATRMRTGLYRFLDHHGIDRQKYNETITLFWIKRVNSFLNRTDTTRSLASIANEMIETCGDSQLIYNYYSKEILSSDEARRMWIEPDVKPLDF